MGKEYVPVFFDWLETTQDLSAEEKGNLIDAVVSYASGRDYEHLLTGGCRIAFRFLKGQVDRNAAISDARSKAGSNRKEQTETKPNKPEQTETKSLIEKEKEEDKENNNKNKKEQRRFTPPTVEEVRAYCRERGNHVDPQRFVDYYTSNGWKVGRNPMKDWRAAVGTWERSDSGGKPAVNSPVQYEHRDYAGADADKVARMRAMMEEVI